MKGQLGITKKDFLETQKLNNTTKSVYQIFFERLFSFNFIGYYASKEIDNCFYYKFDSNIDPINDRKYLDKLKKEDWLVNI